MLNDKENLQCESDANSEHLLTQGKNSDSNGFLLLMRREQDLALQDSARRSQLDAKKIDLEAKRLALIEKYFNKIN